ncbi:Ribosomal protein P2 [Giardia duodenalis]|uniref:Ribosomal protein P2 n=2 Tax=Giardia intestinalis TaxID=5741 RepID=A8BCP0_GIAIC|nr:Ribosomal protein P2 [Giardia intestinalis]KAE8301337.1 Ribosomal protein P2 [Giardia intestinalis]|eukprot:XP_001707951.1 Hypothetical protein GL50803_16588 [Giardia lamblia ATCC 50803]
MKHLAAYLLAKMGGKNEPAVADIEKIIAAVGGTTDADLAKTVVEKVGAGGLSVEDLMSLGKKRMASMPAVGAAPAAASTAAAVAEAAPAAAKKEESDDDEIVGAGGMFGGDSSSSEEESSSD